ncbi:MAG: family metallopeptidase [Devosia sp.]|nr:family metallopeptidase [Devosia sp.]
MQLTGRYYDGHLASPLDVICQVEPAAAGPMLAVYGLISRELVEQWPAGGVYPVPGRKGEMRIGMSAELPGARLLVTDAAEIERATAMLPALGEHSRADSRRQLVIAASSSLALVAVILTYLVGVPILAERVVWLVPPQWEENLGETVAMQMEDQFREQGTFVVCDPNPQSVANRALARFGQEVLADTNSPFNLSITVVKSEIANAFALPGGRTYIFSALMDTVKSPDEFAGVVAHEIGHVVYRHGFEQIIATAGTGALVGFILGDMTGLSVAAGLGSALIDTRFSRQHERQADEFSAAAALRLGFSPHALGDLLDRIAADDDMTKALALLSTHPLTEERRLALEAQPRTDTPGPGPFSAAEWRAITAMCDSVPLRDATTGT